MEHDASVKVIYRYDEPTKLDTANYLTLCEVKNELTQVHDYKYFVQLSKNSEEPDWEFLGPISLDMIIKLLDLLK